MDFKPNNFEDDSEFQEMLLKMQNTQLNSTLLESPSSTKYGLSSNASRSYSPQYIKSPQFRGGLNKHCLQNTARKALSFSQNQSHKEDYDNNNVSELDLNKTYSSKTMNHMQLSLMLAALEDDDKD